MSPIIRVSVLPTGWSACRAVGRRRSVVAWSVIHEDGGEAVVGLITRGSALVRADRLEGFLGYAAGAGTEPQIVPPALPPADLNEAMLEAVDVDADSWEVYETRIRSALAAAAATEFATAALAGFDLNPNHWFRMWLLVTREHEATQADLWRRLRVLSLTAPGRSLEQALADTGQTLGGWLAAPEPPTER